MSIQIYGQWHDWNSFSNVSRAISCEFRKRHLDASIYGLGQLGQSYKEAYLPAGFNNAASVGIFIGYPETAPSWLAGHETKLLVTVCETDRVPQSWVDACNQMSLVIVPSQWCFEAFKNSGVNVEIMIMPHGVWPINSTPVVVPNLSFLHVSGSLSFAARKGTSALLLAFKKFQKQFTSATLTLKVPFTYGYLQILEDFKNVGVTSSMSLSPKNMSVLYQTHDAVVQPSRAEGFGLVPLEARCLGVPTIMTAVTGHREHFVPEVDTEIMTRLMSPLETQANPVGSAPEVKVTDIYNALMTFAANGTKAHERTKAWADMNRQRWSWSNVLRPLIAEVRSRDTNKKVIRLGAGASLRGA